MTEKTRLIIRVDDAGSSWSSNVGCYRACTQGIAQSVEVMMPGAWVTHAANLFNAHPDIDIGIHLTLTAEWDAVKWRPLTQAPSLTDKNGFFLPLLAPREGDGRPCLQEVDWSLDEVAIELRAQIELGIAMFPQASHVSCHMARHFRDVDPQLGDLIAELCAESGLADDAFGHGLPRIAGYPKYPTNGSDRTAAFAEEVGALPPGDYIFIDHPAEASPELIATGHRGYDDVAADRVGCLQALIDPTLRHRMDALGISLINYRSL